MGGRRLDSGLKLRDDGIYVSTRGEFSDGILLEAINIALALHRLDAVIAIQTCFFVQPEYGRTFALLSGHYSNICGKKGTNFPNSYHWYLETFALITIRAALKKRVCDLHMSRWTTIESKDGCC
jgi:hypothetical protein